MEQGKIHDLLLWPFYWRFSVIYLQRYSVGFDIDPDAIKIAQENSESFDVNIDFVNTDLSIATLDGFKGKLDTIIMNPPFGTKNNKGVDMVLLKKAIDVKSLVAA